MSNTAPSDNVVLRQAIEQIQSCLPAHWSTSLALKTNDAADARLTIRTPAGASAALAIGARRQLDPRLVGEVAGALRSAAADAFVVIAPFLGARTRERLTDEGVGYVDLAGNMRLVLDRPTVLIAARGGEKNPWAEPRNTRSLHAAKASRLVRALCDGEPRGPVTLVHRARLIRRWALDYRFREAHRFVSFAHAHGVPGALAALRDAGVPYALTARAGAAALLEVALPGTVTAYVDNPERVAATIGAVPIDAGGNVVLIDAFDPFALEGGFEAGGLRYAARAQIIADLLDSPAPGPAQAAAMLANLV